jgi:DNA uptake protein ComE-like DNA-binding protein
MRNKNMNEESIYIEEDFEPGENGQGYKTWEEEIKVTGDELVGKVQELIKEATARKITIKDENGKTLLSVPLWSGVLGVMVFGGWSALALIAAWAANLSIIIEYVDLEDIKEAAEEAAGDVVEAVADDLTAIKGIGPKKAEQLYAAGVYTYAQLARVSPAELAEIASVSEETAVAWIAAAKELS